MLDDTLSKQNWGFNRRNINSTNTILGEFPELSFHSESQSSLTTSDTTLQLISPPRASRYYNQSTSKALSMQKSSILCLNFYLLSFIVGLSGLTGLGVQVPVSQVRPVRACVGWVSRTSVWCPVKVISCPLNHAAHLVVLKTTSKWNITCRGGTI